MSAVPGKQQEEAGVFEVTAGKVLGLSCCHFYWKEPDQAALTLRPLNKPSGPWSALGTPSCTAPLPRETDGTSDYTPRAAPKLMDK